MIHEGAYALGALVEAQASPAAELLQREPQPAVMLMT